MSALRNGYPLIRHSSRSVCNSFTSTCSFPGEILDEIVAQMLAGKQAFSSIANFTLVSYQFRQIALRRFFVRLYARSKSHWTHLCQIPGVYSWTRQLECLSTTLLNSPQTLACFSNIRAVEIDLCNEGLSTQTSIIKRIFKFLPPLLTALKLTYLPHVDVTLLSLIANNFLDLVSLELTCTERVTADDCCWDCYEESSSCTLHSPIPDIYSDADDLTYAFGSALSPLKKLQHLHLGIFLSELDIFYCHLFNCQLDPDPMPFQIVQAPSWPLAPYGPDICNTCHDLFGDEVRATELFASAAIARFIPSLKTVCWSSFFVLDEPGDNAVERSTTVWVLRKDGKVRVRRAPW